jgi:hypothetical protein
MNTFVNKTLIKVIKLIQDQEPIIFKNKNTPVKDQIRFDFNFLIFNHARYCRIIEIID